MFSNTKYLQIFKNVFRAVVFFFTITHDLFEIENANWCHLVPSALATDD